MSGSVCVGVMKQGRGSADATLPRVINQTRPATEPVQIGLISLGIKKDIKVQGQEKRKGDKEKYWGGIREI